MRFDTLGLYAAYGEQKRVSLREAASLDGFIDEMRKEATEALASDTFVHGQRTEALFERIVAELGTCRVLKHEDAGEVFYRLDGPIQPADFRVVLDDGTERLIEVKNFRSRNGQNDFGFKTSYLESLEAYAKVMGRELLIATYWVHANRWTLVSPSRFARQGDRRTIPLIEALTQNEMHLLGDLFIGSRSPMKFRIVSDPTEPRRVEEDGAATFTIKCCELWSEGRLITSPAEQKLGTFLYLYGDWEILESPMHAEAGEVIYVEHHFGLDEEISCQERNGFEIVGVLSSMISRRHALATSEGGEVHGIRAPFMPGEVLDMIPEDYRGEALPIFRHRVHPKRSE